MHSVRFINIGIPRSGKTTLWRRLMKKILNIVTAKEIEQPSTGLAEQHQVVIQEIGMLTPDDWHTLDEFEEAKTILQIFVDHISSEDTSSTNASLRQAPALAEHQLVEEQKTQLHFLQVIRTSYSLRHSRKIILASYGLG